MRGAEFEAGLRRAHEITHSHSHHLAKAAARMASPEQRAFFDVAYATMRIADDLVDESFLRLPAAERGEQRASALRELQYWTTQAEACAAGDLETATSGAEPELFTALCHFLSRSDLGARPWQLLARSLRRDVHEHPIESWADYLSYAEGACIAPASVFVHLLGSEFDARARSRYRGHIPPVELARDLALYAYLVHMLRDLRKDAAIHPQLVQLPRVWLTDCGIGPEELAGQAGAALLPIVLRVRGLALSRREAAERALERAQAALDRECGAVLQYVLELYDRTAREIGVLEHAEARGPSTRSATG